MTADPRFARLYDAQYRDFDLDLDLWLGLAQGADPVLELGCGSGRVLLPLVQAGQRVAGVDNDPHMLARAAARLADSAPGAATLVRADLVQLPFAPRFELALAPLNTLATFDQAALQQIFAGVAASLAPGGRLVCELPHPLTALEEAPDPDEILDAFFEPESGQAVQVHAGIETLAGGNAYRVSWVYDLLDPQGGIEQVPFEQVFHLRSPEQLQALGAPAGLALQETFGEYDGDPYGADSTRLIAVFRRAP